MKAGPECLNCLRNLARQTTELATSDPLIRSEIERRIAKILERLSPSTVPTDLSNEFHPIIKKLSGNPDPYREWKLREIEMAKLAFLKVRPRRELRGYMEIAAQGNAIDFFVDPESLDRELSVGPNFAIDDIAKLERKLGSVKDILYLADNAAEVFFDLPLLAFLKKKARVGYVVKESPVQNDLSIEDVRVMMLRLPVEMIPSPATVGFYPDRASPKLRERFARADLVVAKGMGNYETLSELPESGKFFYIFRAKCGPVARSLSVKVGDYVAMLR